MKINPDIPPDSYARVSLSPVAIAQITAHNARAVRL